MNRKTLRTVRKICKIMDMEISPEGRHCYDLSFFSNYGEDFHFYIQGSTGKNTDFFVDLADAIYDFDPEEHATMWYGQNRGEPSSIRALLNDADYIADQLDTFEDYCRLYFRDNKSWADIKCEMLNDKRI